ncbi:MAG: hypothetical protein AB1782_00260 [Cyanobacteriota bacterium]
MATPFKHIPTLQEYAHQKKMKFIYEHNCLECDYFKRSLLMCVWGDKLQGVNKLVDCPKEE